MPESMLYSFDDTDALLASLSNSSVQNLSPSDIGGSSSKTTSTYGGISPEDAFLNDDEWNMFTESQIPGLSNAEFAGFNIDDSTLSKTNEIEEQKKIYLSPEFNNDASIVKKENGTDIFIKESDTDGDDEDDDDNLRHSPKHMTKESSTGSTSSSGKVSKPKKDRSSHNIIEKKYRTNISMKINALKNSVPTLRIAAGDPGITMNDLEGLSPPSKVNKSSILTKATEYIKHLERKNTNLLSENQHLRQIIGNIPPQAQQQTYPQYAISAQQAPPPPPQGFPQAGDFQPATDINGQPLNITAQQPQQQPYQMGIPAKILMGGLTTLAGTNLFNANVNDYDYRGLNAFPFLLTPHFQSFLNIVKFLLVAFSVVYLLAPSIFDRSNDSSSEEGSGKQQQLVRASDKRDLNEWYKLIKQLVFIHVGDQEKKTVDEKEVFTLVNEAILLKHNENTFSHLAFTLLKLNIYKPSFEVSFGKIILSKLLLAYSDLASSFNILNNIIDKSLVEISHQKVSDTNLRYLYKEFKYSTNNNSEAFKRLLNISMSLPLSHNCEKGIKDKGYELLVRDESVIFDYKKLLSSIRANEVFREVLLEYVDLTFKDSQHLEDDELKETKKELWNKLNLAENLAPKRSIVDIRAKLLKAILNEKYLDATLKLINEESKALKSKENTQKATLRSSNEVKEAAADAEPTSESKVSNDTILESEESIEETEEFDEDSTVDTKEDSNTNVEDAVVEKDDAETQNEEDKEETSVENDSDSETEEEESDTDYDYTVNQSTQLDPKFRKLLSQDLTNALVSSTILKYARSNHRLETSQLLRHIKLNRNEISVLSFISLFKLVQKFPKSWMVYTSDDSEGEVKSQKNSQFDGDFEIIENIVANLRLWVGDSNNVNFKDYEDDGLQIKREISDKLVSVGKGFGYYE